MAELLTSEGYGSCPPIEAFPGALAQRHDVLALTFHVDYRDDRGWRDNLGPPQTVQRQRAYAKTLRLSTIYTPQVVIDGQADCIGSDRSSNDRALAPGRSGMAFELARH